MNNSQVVELISHLNIIDERFGDYLTSGNKAPLLAILNDPVYETSLKRKFRGMSTDEIISLVETNDLFELKAAVHPIREIAFHTFNRQKKPTIPQVHFLYVLSGSCTCTINDRTISLNEGELCLHGPEHAKVYKIEGEGYIIVNCLATIEYMNSILIDRLSKNNTLAYFFSSYLYNNEYHFIHFKSSGSEKLRTLILSAFSEYLDYNACTDEIIKSYMVLIFAELLSICSSPGGAEPPYAMEKTPIAEMLCYIAENCTTATLQSTAEHFHFHPNYFCGTIKRLSGRTFTEILQEAKMNYAYRLLQCSDMPVDKIAAQVGYKNISYFYKLFHKRYGHTPAAMREKLKIELLD